MKTNLSFIKSYFIGVALAVFMIFMEYLYGFLTLGFWKYATASNFIYTCLMCGLPFGIAVYAFSRAFVVKKNM